MLAEPVPSQLALVLVGDQLVVMFVVRQVLNRFQKRCCILILAMTFRVFSDRSSRKNCLFVLDAFVT